jgi:hypothetical protein
LLEASLKVAAYIGGSAYSGNVSVRGDGYTCKLWFDPQRYPVILKMGSTLGLNGADQDAREAVREIARSMHDAMSVWSRMDYVLRALNRVLSDGAQLAYYAPWASRVIDPNIKVNLQDKHEHYRTYNIRHWKQLKEGTRPTSYFPMTREQREFCKEGDQALAQLAMLGDVVRPEAPASHTILTFCESSSRQGSDPLSADSRFSLMDRPNGGEP